MSTTTPSTNVPQIQTINLQPGQIAYIPKNATILSIDGDGTVSSDCIDLTPKPLKCYRFRYATTEPISPQDPAWEEGDFVGFEMAGIFYSTSIPFRNNAGVGGFLQSSSNNIIQLISYNTDVAPSSNIERQDIYVRMPESIASTVYLKMVPEKTDGSAASEIRIYPTSVACEDIS